MLNSLRTRLANEIWVRSYYCRFQDFQKGCLYPEQTQREILNRLLQSNRDTEYGRRYGFGQIKGPEEYADQVPAIDYSDIEREIERCSEGEENILSPERIIRFEETSGSRSHSKLIPYTEGLIREFDAAIGAWLYSIRIHLPQALKGRSYWSLSPATKQNRISSGAIRIGSADDSEYFSVFHRLLLGSIMAVQPGTARIKDPDYFYEQSLLQLLKHTDLTLISVWSPTFFLKLDTILRQRFEHILSKMSHASSSRMEWLSAIDIQKATWKDIWPRLELLSCWTHATSASYISVLRQKLGNVPVQGKGLLSTEGVVSIPIQPTLDPVAAITSHFLEGEDLATGQILPAWKWQEDRHYEVLLSTSGGFYRYRTGDVAQVTGRYLATPCLRFLGRRNQSTDLVGEKLSEFHVLQMLLDLQSYSDLFSKEGALLYGCARGDIAGYFLLANDSRESSSKPDSRRKILEIAEHSLRKNPYYDQARTLGQLAPLRFLPISEEDHKRILRKVQLKKGIKDGDFKVPVLLSEQDLSIDELGVNF